MSQQNEVTVLTEAINDREDDGFAANTGQRFDVMDKSHVWLVFVGLCCSHGPCGCFSVFRTAS